MSQDPQSPAAEQPDDEEATEDSSSNEAPQETLKEDDIEAIERAAVDAVARRAPKYGRFIGAGALVGAVCGVIAAWIARLVTEQTANFGAVVIFSALGLATLGALICGFIAITSDRRSMERANSDESQTDMGE